MDDRKEVLLKAALDMLAKLMEGPYVKSPREVSVFYDGADCGAECLCEDIAMELDIENPLGDY